MAKSVPAARLSIELVAEIARLQTDLDKAKKMVAAASGDIARSAKGANDNLAAMGRGFTKTGGASRVFGQQLSQVGQQVAAGTNALQAFAIQLPDIAVGLGMAGNAASGFAKFLGGPWGIAIATGLAVLAPMVSKLWEAGDAVEDSTKKLQGFGNAAALALQSRHVVEMMSDLGELQAKFTRLAGPSSQSQAFFGNTLAGKALQREIELKKFDIQQTQNIIDLRDKQIRQIEAADAATKNAAKSEREHNKELREQAKALREAAAAAKKYSETVMGGAAMRDLRNMGAVVSGSELDRAIGETNKLLGEELKRRQDAAIENAALEKQTQEIIDHDHRERALKAAHEVADIIGGGFGRAFNGLISALDQFKGLFAKIGSIQIGGLGALGDIFKGAGVGAAAGGLVGSGKGSAIGGALGGAAGQALGSTFSALGSFGGPLGAIAGGILGSVIGGLFGKVKKASATIEIIAGQAAQTSLSGNSSKLKAVAGAMADSLISGLGQIADQLGGSLGNGIKVSIGQRKNTFRVDLQGLGRTKNMPSFASQEEAVAFAIQSVIQQGAIIGLRAGTAALLKGEGDLEGQLTKALKFESVFKELEQRANPLISTMDAIAKEFTALIDIFEEAGATVEDYAKLQELMAIKQKEAIEAAFEPIRAMLDDLKTKADTAGEAVRTAFDAVLSREAEAVQAYEDGIAAQAEAAREAFNAGQQRWLEAVTTGFTDEITRIKDAIGPLHDEASALAQTAEQLRNFAGGIVTPGSSVRFSAGAATAAAQAGDLDRLAALRDAAMSGATDRFSQIRNLAILRNAASSAAGGFAGRASGIEAQIAMMEQQVSGIEQQVELAKSQVKTLEAVDKSTVDIARLLSNMETAKAAADVAREQMAKLTELTETEITFADAVAAYETAKAMRDDLIRGITEAGFANLIEVQKQTGAQLLAAVAEVAARAAAATDAASRAIVAAQAAQATAAANDNMWSTYDIGYGTVQYRSAPAANSMAAEIGAAVAEQVAPALYQIARNTGKAAITLEDFDRVGMPDVRSL